MSKEVETVRLVIWPNLQHVTSLLSGLGHSPVLTHVLLCQNAHLFVIPKMHQAVWMCCCIVWGVIANA